MDGWDRKEKDLAKFYVVAKKKEKKKKKRKKETGARPTKAG